MKSVFAAHANAPTHPHPLVGTSLPLPSKITHPIMGAVDRIVDSLTGGKRGTP